MNPRVPNRRPVAAKPRRAIPLSKPSWRCSPRSARGHRLRRDRAPRRRLAGELRDKFPPNSDTRSHLRAIDRAVLAGHRRRHGRGAPARAAVRRADAPARRAVAPQGSDRSLRRSVLCNPGSPFTSTGWRCVPCNDADRRRHLGRGPEGMVRAQGFRSCSRRCCCDMGQRRRRRQAPTAGGARPRARPASAGRIPDDLCRIPQAACNARRAFRVVVRAATIAASRRRRLSRHPSHRSCGQSPRGSFPARQLSVRRHNRVLDNLKSGVPTIRPAVGAGIEMAKEIRRAQPIGNDNILAFLAAKTRQ